MSLLSWLRGKTRNTSQKARSDKRHKPSRWKRYQPNMEALEQRLAPATRWVDNTPGPGNFFTASGGTQPPLFGPLTPGVDLFATIQAAVTAASPGDVINVSDGTYNEFVQVNKTLTIQGNQFGVDARPGRVPATETIVDQNASAQAGFYLTASNVVLDGFTIQNSTNGAFPGFAVLMGAGTTGSQVLDNIIQNNIVGIAMANTGGSQAKIQFNLIRNNNQAGPASGTGIYTDQFAAGGTLANVLIDSNRFVGNASTGVRFASTDPGQPATGITVSNNDFVGNGRPIAASNLTVSSILNNTIDSQGVTVTGGSDLTLTGNNITGGGPNGISLVNITGTVSISGNTISGKTVDGIRVLGSGSGTVSLANNTVTGNDEGIRITDYTTVNLTNNTVSGNTNNSVLANITSLNLTTSSAADTVTVNGGPNRFAVTGGNVFQTTQYSGLGSFTIFTLGGDDELIVDFSAGNPVPPGGISFNAGGNPGDDLMLLGGTFQTETFSYTNLHDGAVAVDPDGPGGVAASVISYTGLAPISSTVTAADVILNYSTASETITVADSGTAGQTTVSSTAGETTTFANPTNSLTINAGDVGDDIVNVNSFGSGFNKTLTIGGGTGNDAITINPALNLSASGASLTLSAESITLNGGSVSTSAGQSYNGAVTLGAGTTLTSTGGGNITFTGTVNGGFSLTVNTNGTTTFGGAVGGTTALTSLTTDAGGSTAINGGGVTTTGAQSYNDAVTLGATDTFTSTGSGNVSFASTVNGGFSLTVNTAGTTTFGGAVGGSTALASLTTDASGSTALNGGSVTTTGTQTYNDAVTLGAGTTLTSTAGGNLNLNSTVNGAQALTLVAGSGNINLGSAGGTTPLTSFTITSVNNVTAGAITAGTITQTAGSGTSSLSGLLHATGAAGLSLNGNNFSITGGITVDAGPASITDAGTLIISSVPVSLGGNTLTIADTGAATVSSAINGSGGALVKNATGTLTLTAANGYTGATTVNAGTLLVNGSITSNTTINSGGTLGGTGTVSGTVTANSGGTVAPGSSPGILNTGSVNFTGGSTFDVEIGGTTAGNYDQLNVSGTVTISTSATLNTTSFGGFVPGASDNYIIINNDGSDPITGNFSGLPEGAIISTNFLGSGQTAHITYAGGDGNDVAIVLAGPVVFNGDNTGENFELRQVTSGSGNLIQLLRNGIIVDSRPTASVTSYTINGNGGSDTLTVNYGASGGFFTFPVTFHGGVGDFDRLIVTGGTFTNVTHTFTTTGPEHSGNILYDTGTSTDLVTYDGLDPVDMTGSAIANLVFSLPGANDQAIVEDDGTVGNGISRIRSQNGAPTFETTTFSNPGSSLTINMGGDSGTLTFGAPDFTRTLTIDGQAGTDNVVFQGTNSITALGVIVAGSVTDASGTTLNVANNATFTAGSVVLGDNPGDTTNFGTLTFAAGGNVSISEDSDMDLAGANSANTLTLNAAGNINVLAGASLTATTSATFTSPLVINGGNVFFTGAAVTATDVTLNAGNLQAPNASGSFLVSGNWTKTGGTFNPNNGTVTFTKPAGVQTLNSGGSAFNNIAHPGAGTVQLTGNPITINGTLSNSAGVFYLNGFNLTMNGAAGNFSNDATFRLQGGETITGLIQDTDSGLWEYVGVSNATSQLFTIKDFGGTDYFNLLINTTDGLDAFETGANLKVAGTFTVQAGTFDANGNTTIVIGLTTVNGGTYLASFATQSLTGGLTVTSGAFTGSDGTVTTTNVTLTGGTLTAPNSVGAFNVSGNWTVTGGTFNANGGTVTFTGSGTQTINTIAAFNNLQHTGTGTVQVSGTTLNVAGNLTNAAGAGNFDANGRTVTVTGATTVAGGTYLPGTGTQNFNGGLNVAGGTFSGSTGTVNVGDVNITSGTLIAPTGPFNVAGNWFKGGGVFNANGATVTFTKASGTQTLDSGGALFNNITHSGAGVLQLAGTSLSVGGAFTNAAGAGNFDANGQNTSITGLTTVSGNSFLGSTGTQSFFGGLLLTGATVSSTGAGSLVLGSGVTSNASAASSTISGNLNLGGAVRTFTVANGAAVIDLDVSAAISNGGVTLTGGGTLRYSGSVANSYTGTTTVNAGILLLAKAGAAAVAGNLVIGDGVGGANADVVRLALSEQIADTSAVTIQSSGLLDLTSFSETIGSLAGSGNLTFGTDAIDNTLTVGNATSTLFSGQFIGNDGGLDQVLKVGTGTLTLSGASPFTGRYTINGGTLLVNGSIASSTQAVTVNSGGTLGGLGTINRAVNVDGGTVAPGTSPGILNTGSVTFVTGSSFNVELGGPTPGNGAGFHDQLNVTGTVAIGTAFPGVSLNVTSFGGFVPSGGEEFRIINNDGSDPTIGNFAGLPEGAAVSTNFLGSGQTAHITYKGGDGNDVALVVTGTVTYSAPDDGLPDTLELRLDSSGTNLQFLINGVIVDSRPLSAVTDVTVNGADGPGDDDTLIINYTNGFFAIPVTFHGGTDASDALIVTGGSFVTVTHTFVASTPEHSGSILYDDGTSTALISYDGLEPVDLTGSLISNLIFNLPGAADNAILEDDGLAGNLVSRIRSQANDFETTTFANTVGNLLVNMGGDDGTLTVASLPDFAHALSINGQGGTDAVLFQGTTSFTELNVTLSGSITDAVGTSLTVSGQATLNAGGGVITLGDNATDTTNFGSLNVTGGSVTISEDSATLLTGVNAGGLSLTSAGDITDAPGTTITVSGLASFNAGANAITLGDDAADVTTFGSLTVTGGAVTLSTDAATQLAGTNQASTLTLTAAGDITDAPGTTLAVTGLATFNAGGSAITLGDSPTDTTNFGSLSVTGGAVQISEDSATVLTAVSAGSLTLTSSGGITDAPGTSIAVIGLASFTSVGNPITLGDNPADSTNFGLLNLNAGAVTISEDSATELAGSNTVASLHLTSAGAITDAAGTFLFVSGQATFDAGGNAIDLGNSAGDTVLFGTLTVTGGSVTISADTATQFTGVNTAASLTLNAAGAITDAAGTTFAVSGLATFNAGANAITLGDSPTDTTNFGSLSLTGGAVTITEDSASDIAGAAVGSLTLTSAGTISVNGKVTATGSVQLISAASVVVNAAIDPTTVALQSNDNIVINAAVTATNSITLLAGQDGSGGVSITGTGSLTTTNAGSTISITTGSISGNIALAGNVASGGQITLNPLAGNTTQTGGAITAPNLLLTGTGAFQLTQTGNDVDTIAADLNPGSINFQDVDDLTVGSVGSTNGIATGNPANGGDVILTAGGLLTVNQSINTQNGSGGTVTVGGGVVVNAPLIAGQGNIVLNGGAAIGDLVINSPIIQATTINLSAQRDIIVAALVQTTTPTADINLVADSDGDGVGGVWIQVPGKLDSGRNVAVEGSDLFATPGSADSIRIDNDAGNDQIVAVGNITLTDRSGAFVPAAADTIVSGIVRSSGPGAVSISARHDIQLSSTIGSAGGPITFNDPVVLTGDAVVSSGVGDVTFTSTVNGNHALTINSSGLTNLEGVVGGVTPLANLTTDAGGTTRLGANISTLGATTFNDAVQLLGDLTLTAGSLTANGTVDGAFDLTLAVTGASTFVGAVGGTTPLGDGTGAALGVDSTGATEFQGTVHTGSGIAQADTAGAITFRQDVTITGGDTASTFDANVVLDGLTVSSDGAVSFGNSAADVLMISGGPVTITLSDPADALNILAGVNLGTPLTINDAGPATISGQITGASSLTKIGGGTLTITGNNNYTGGTNLNAGTLAVGNNSALGTGTAALNGGTLRADGAARTLGNALTFGGNFTIGGTFDLTFNGLSTLTGDRTVSVSNTGLTTFNGAIRGTVAGNEGLTLQGSGAVALGTVGTVPLEFLALPLSGQVTLNGNITTDNTLGSGLVDLSAATGGIRLGGTITINTDAAGNGSGGAVNLSGSAVNAASAGGQGLTVNAPAGNVTLGGAAGIGATNALSFLTISNAGNASFGGVVNTTGNLTQTAGSGTTTLRGGTIGGNLDLTTSAIAQVGGTLTVGTTAKLNPLGGGVNQTGGALIAPNLLLTGAGMFSLNQSGNNVNIIAANVTGPIMYQEANGLTIGTVNGTNGIHTHNNNLGMMVGGSLTVDQPINVGSGNMIAITVGAQTAGGTPVLVQLHNAATVTAASATITARNGGGGPDTLQGPDRDSAWTITANGGGTLANSNYSTPINFQQFESLHGGTLNDTFIFSTGSARITGLVDGDFGFDTLDVSGIPNANITVTGPGSKDGFQGNGSVVGAFDNINARGGGGGSGGGSSVAFAVSTGDSQVYVHLFDPAGNPMGNWNLVAPGQFLSVVSDVVGPDRAPIVFGLGTDHRIYAARFRADGSLAFGWFLVAPGFFNSMAVSNYGANSAPIVFGLSNGAGGNQVYAARFDAQGNFQVGWYLVAPGAFTYITAGQHGSGGAPELFGISGTQVYAASFDTNGNLTLGWFFVAPGSFKQLTVNRHTDGTQELFGLGTNSQVYGANFDTSGNLTMGWFGTAPGQFFAIAAGPVGGLQGLSLATDQSIHRRFFAATFDSAGQRVSGWTVLNNGPYQPVSANNAVTSVFALEANETLFDDSIYTNGGFFKLPPGPFKSLSVVS